AYGPVPPGVLGYREPPEGVNPVVYDLVDGKPVRKSVDTARKLLAEAGYANGVDASMVVFQGLGIYTTMAQVVQANLKEVGINLKLEPVEWATLV
ncbi:ABC transporter substrate-binding protein, partial [Escherichia coli]|uniref:ABC transporter substrate-binding protein n=1 Tax=Escherichia coli TaxID=562 RepID=UPI002284B7CB